MNQVPVLDLGSSEDQCECMTACNDINEIRSYTTRSDRGGEF